MDEIIEKIDLHWRAANYLSLARLYLADNPTLDKELGERDLKKRHMGHWGVCPSINFIYAHLNHICKKRQCKIQLIVGTGHGGNAILSNLYLEGSLQEKYDFLTPDYEGLVSFLNIEEMLENMRAEVNPLYPGTIYDGGELGYSLAVAFGSVLDKKGSVTVCVIGDGEAETGTLSASWNLIDFLNDSDGRVLPILNLNGFKMGSRSILSKKTDSELKDLFRGYGYEAVIVNANHEQMIEALEYIWDKYEKDDCKAKYAPMIILKSPKGWTAPCYEGQSIENSVLSHKDPLMHIKDIHARIDFLSKWLLSYRPHDFFNNHGGVRTEIKELMPEIQMRMGETEYKRLKLDYPNVNKYKVSKAQETYSNIRILSGYLQDLISHNPGIFRIVSPDELASNRLGELTSNECVMEILNENICQGWMQGYNLTGRNSVMIAYEAFMPIIDGMLSQYIKFLKQAQYVKWRKLKPSMNYILTSVCWENTYSHQNPGFVSSLLLQNKEHVKVYFPIDANTLMINVDLIMRSEGLINVVTISKHELPQYLQIDEAYQAVKQGYWQWTFGNNDPDIVLIVAGDQCLSEMFESVRLTSTLFPQVNFKVISIIDLTRFSCEFVEREPGYSDFEQTELFCPLIPRIIFFHGYRSAIPSVLNKYVLGEKRVTMGFKNNSMRSEDYLEKMKANECSRYDILRSINKLLYEDGRVTETDRDKIDRRIYEMGNK